ncbi:MAG: glycosyltransferase family 39 protein, partial [Chloroflexota bacterium]|nr:glycosyltransferase family 39 protein [Chloroflexota bacterium]
MARGARNQQPQARTRIDAVAHWLLALGLLLIALPITFHNLGVQSLWLDEGVTQAYVTGQRLGTLLLDLLAPWQGYPLYYLVVKVTTRALGDSEWALRQPSALAGGLAVPALYLLGTELRGRAVGLAAAALLLLAPWGLWQAQDAKPYSLALLAAIVLALLFARALRLGTRRAWLWWIIVALAAPFVHRLLLLSLLGCAACWALFQPRARRWPTLFATAAAAMLVLAAIAGLLRYQRAGGQFRDVGPLHAARLTFEQFSVRQFAGDVPGLWFVPFGLLLLLGAFRCWFDLRRGAGSRESGVRGRKTKLLTPDVPLPTPDAGRPAPGSRLPAPD